MTSPFIASGMYYIPMQRLRDELAELLISAMKKADANGLEVAEAASVTNSYVTRLKKGKANPTLDVVEAIFDGLGQRITLQLDSTAADDQELLSLSRQCSPEVLQLAKTMMRQSAELERRQQA